MGDFQFFTLLKNHSRMNNVEGQYLDSDIDINVRNKRFGLLRNGVGAVYACFLLRFVME